MTKTPIDFSNLPVDSRTAVGVGQLATGAMKGTLGHTAGAALAAVEGSLDLDDSRSRLDAMAQSLGMSAEEYAALSTPVTNYLSEQENKPVENVGRFGVTTVASVAGAGALGAMLGNIAIPGFGMVAGLAGGATAGYFANEALTATVGESHNGGVEHLLAMGSSPQIGTEVSYNPGDVFVALTSRLSSAEQQIIADSVEHSSATPNELARQYDHLFQPMAKALCTEYDPAKNACEQIAETMQTKNLPPAILLIDPQYLPQALAKLENARQASEQEPQNIDEASTLAPSQLPPRKSTRGANPSLAV